MIQKLQKCQIDDHQGEINSVCYNQDCKKFRLNCLNCITKEKIHLDHINEVDEIRSLNEFTRSKYQESDDLIDELSTLVEDANFSFSQLIRGIRLKYQLYEERLVQLNSLQINDFLNQTIRFNEYKQSFTTAISEQIKKLTNSFNLLYEQLKLYQILIFYLKIFLINISSFNYYQIDDNNIKLSKELYDQGNKLNLKFSKFLFIYCEYKFDEAIKTLDKSIQENPNNHQSLWCKGSCLLAFCFIILYIIQKKKYDNAITWLDNALAINPKHVNSLNDKGMCLFTLLIILYIRSLNKYDDAISWLDKALDIDPKYVTSLRLKGRLHHKFNQQVNVYQHMINHFYLRSLKKYEDAITWLDKALVIDPKHVISLSQKSRLNHNFNIRLMFIKVLLMILLIKSLKKYKDAITWLDKALAIDSNHIISLSDKGECLSKHYSFIQKYDQLKNMMNLQNSWIKHSQQINNILFLFDPKEIVYIVSNHFVNKRLIKILRSSNLL